MIAVRDGIGQFVDKNRQLVGPDRAGRVPSQGVMIAVVDNPDILGFVRNILPDKPLDNSRSASIGAVEGRDRIAVRAVDGRAVDVGLLRAGATSVSVAISSSLRLISILLIEVSVTPPTVEAGVLNESSATG